MAIRIWLPIATAGALLAFAGRAEPVDAHPHVWIDAVVTFVFEDGQLVGLRHHWKFDEFFGSFRWPSP
jgi:nickel/cobalt transporter (NicO) family protein